GMGHGEHGGVVLRGGEAMGDHDGRRRLSAARRPLPTGERDLVDGRESDGGAHHGPRKHTGRTAHAEVTMARRPRNTPMRRIERLNQTVEITIALAVRVHETKVLARR